MRLLLVVLLILLVLAALLFFRPGGYLVVDQPQKSDAIVVLGGDSIDLRYWRGMDLLRAGYGKELILDVVPGEVFGHSTVELAQDFLARTAGANAPQVSVCQIYGDSTKAEAPQATACIRRLQPGFHSAVIVSDDYHTRRALSIFRDLEPQYEWTAAAARNDYLFGVPWWKHREWAKTYLTEVQKLLYWELFDRWRK